MARQTSQDSDHHPYLHRVASAAHAGTDVVVTAERMRRRLLVAAVVLGAMVAAGAAAGAALVIQRRSRATGAKPDGRPTDDHEQPPTTG